MTERCFQISPPLVPNWKSAAKHEQ